MTFQKKGWLPAVLALTSIVGIAVVVVIYNQSRSACRRQEPKNLGVRNAEVVNFNIPISSVAIDNAKRNLVVASRKSSKLYTLSLSNNSRSSDIKSRVKDVIDTKFSGFSYVKINESSEYLVAGTMKGETVVWKADAGSKTGWGNQGEVLPGTHGGFVTSTAISKDGEYISSSGGDSIFVWRKNKERGDIASSWSLVSKKYGAHSGPTVWSIVFEDANRFLFREKLGLISVGNDSRARVWKIFDDNASNSLSEQSIYEAQRQINSVLFDPRTSNIFLGLNNGSIDVISEDTFQGAGSGKAKPSDASIAAHAQQPVKAFAVPRNLDVLVTGSNDQTVKIWSICMLKQLDTFREHKDWVNAVDISPDGKYIVSGSEDNNVVIRIMN